MIKKSILLLSSLCLLVSCAKKGSITGGPQDIHPPKILRTSPENYSTNFNSNSINIEFDEFVKIKDASKQLIISPPLKYNPEITPYSATKKINIRIKDTLAKNTTYSFNFGQSIEDNNEGNKLQGYKYIFSTGDYIDSLSISGNVYNSFNRETEPFISVMLYPADNVNRDSIVFKEKPRYITNTLDSTTSFKIENIKAGNYILIALKDKNNNNKFDPNDDKIGFNSQIISIPTEKEFNIGLFKENPSFKADNIAEISKNRLNLGYLGDISSKTIQVKNVNTNLETKITKVENKDSVNVWFKPIQADSLQIYVSDKKTNILEKKFNIKLREKKIDSLNITHSGSKHINFISPIVFNNSTPIVNIQKDFISVVNKDSLAIEFKVKYDSLNQQIHLDFDKEENQNYLVQFKKGAFRDFFEKENSDFIAEFTTGNYSDYGNLTLNLQNIKQHPILIELLDEKDKVIYQNTLTEGNITEFKSIDPAKYYLRIIYDSNNNQKWDTGNYINQIQPEKVIFYPEVLDVRANWDIEQTFILKD